VRSRNGLQLASRIAWVWGILFAIAGIALGIPAIAKNGI
jgi:hypothetical protein